MDPGEFQRYAKEAFRQIDEGAPHPSLEEIKGFIEGNLAENRRKEISTHLAGCVQCRERAAEFEQFLSESGGSPSAALDPEGLDPEWQDLRRRIRRRKLITMPWRIGAIAAAITSAIGLSYFAWRALAPSTGQLLASAYREQRGSEFRFAGGGYAPLRQERGAGSAFSMPGSLLKAQARLADDLHTHPDDPELLRLRGEAEMLAGEPTAAVQTLLHASDLLPHNARILADLGAAYGMLADAERRPEEYERAVESLSEALRLDPRNSEALFNLSLTLEKKLLFDQALQKWEEYLKLDSGPWSNEARRHRDDLKPKVKAKEKALDLLHDPAAFLMANEGSVDAEAYLREVAVSEWLPLVESSRPARDALERLAQILNAKHGDHWLAGVLAESTPSRTVGMGELAAARSANQKRDASKGLALAGRARQDLERAGSHTAALWAGFEEVVAQRSLIHSEACMEAAGRLLPDLDRLPYPWLRAETRLEEVTCSTLRGDLDPALAAARAASAISRDAGLGELALRAGNMSIDLLNRTGTPSEVYAKAANSLRVYWSGGYPAYRFYQVVDTLRRLNYDAGRSGAAYYFARSAVWSSAFQPDAGYRLAAHAYLAACAAAVGERAEARQERSVAESLFAGDPKPEYIPFYLEPQIFLGATLLAAGPADSALSLLEAIQPTMRFPHSSRMEVTYFAALGEAHRRKQHIPQAVEAFRQSIGLGEKWLASASEREKSGIIQTLEDSYRGLVAATLTAGQEDEALRIWQHYRALDQSGEAVTETGEPNLVYAELPDGFAAWLLSSGGPTYRRLTCSRPEASAVVTRFLRESSGPAASRSLWSSDARLLYRWMIQPFESKLAGRALAVSPDGILTSVPLQALIAGDGAYLGDRYTVTVSPGYAARATQSRISPSDPVVIVANPAAVGESAARFPPLADSLKEAESARAAFPAADVLQGREATVGALVARLPKARIVHFAGHGDAGSGRAMLLFAPQPGSGADYMPLRSEDIARQDWSHCRVAVLSACAAASGEARGAHNPQSLVRAIIKAGAASVAASLWNVDSAAGSALMRSFYASLAEGQTPASAMQSAQREVRRRPEWAEPYYWAGFQVYGAN